MQELFHNFGQIVKAELDSTSTEHVKRLYAGMFGIWIHAYNLSFQSAIVSEFPLERSSAFGMPFSMSKRVQYTTDLEWYMGWKRQGEEGDSL